MSVCILSFLTWLPSVDSMDSRHTTVLIEGQILIFKASLSNKAPLCTLAIYRASWLANHGCTSRHAITHVHYNFMEPYLFSWEETPGFFAGSTVSLLRSHCISATCNTLGLFAGSGDPTNVQNSQCMSGALFVGLFCWLCCDPSSSAYLTMHHHCRFQSLNCYS